MSKLMLKEFVPPILIKLYKYKNGRYGWFGDYKSWNDAEKDSKGYDSDKIINKVKEASLKVKNGEAEFERDSVLFYEKDYEWPLLTAFLWVAAKRNNNLRIIDYGGALGSKYFQYKHMLNHIEEIKWFIVEQEKFYNIGKTTFEDEVLKFFPDVESCLSLNKIDALLLGCVLPYLQEPYKNLEGLIKYKIPYLIIDKMPFIDASKDRLTVQKVPPQIYSASYPAWFFSYSKFIEFITPYYSIVAEYECKDKANIESNYKGLILQIKNSA